MALVDSWLGTWQPNEQCTVNNIFEPHREYVRYVQHETLGSCIEIEAHDIPMPHASDALAMQVLRKATHDAEYDSLLLDIIDALSVASDPRDAIILAAGEWLRGQASAIRLRL